MIIVKYDKCGYDIDYNLNGVNVNFNHYGTVKMNGGEKEYQVCNVCASKIDNFIKHSKGGRNKMNETFDKIIKRLKSEVNYNDGAEIGLKQAIKIVTQEAEEYSKKEEEEEEIIKNGRVVFCDMEQQCDCKNKGWTPCSEKLPQQNELMKVWLSFTNNICSYVKRAIWCYDHFEYDNGKIMSNNPVAWKKYDPPKPYQPKGE